MLMHLIKTGLVIYLAVIPVALLVFASSLCVKGAGDNIIFDLGKSRWMKIPMTVLLALAMAVVWPYVLVFILVEMFEERR